MSNQAPLRIVTVRLVLSAPQASDAAGIFDRYASNPEVTQYLGWPRDLGFICKQFAFLFL